MSQVDALQSMAGTGSTSLILGLVLLFAAIVLVISHSGLRKRDGDAIFLTISGIFMLVVLSLCAK